MLRLIQRRHPLKPEVVVPSVELNRTEEERGIELIEFRLSAGFGELDVGGADHDIGVLVEWDSSPDWSAQIINTLNSVLLNPATINHYVMQDPGPFRQILNPTDL